MSLYGKIRPNIPVGNFESVLYAHALEINMTLNT